MRQLDGVHGWEIGAETGRGASSKTATGAWVWERRARRVARSRDGRGSDGAKAGVMADWEKKME